MKMSLQNSGNDNEMYVQSLLARNTAEGREHMISWIPLCIAQKGKTVRLKDAESGIWTENWTVMEEAKTTLPYKVLKRDERDYKKTRKASDI